ncbi:MAG: hypothetical protein LUE11_07045 [Clostridia bacterium]|nr:hypothetical protein [Clostridia bacterium]
MIDVVSKQCSAGTIETFALQTTSVSFRVKNFTDDFIKVCLGKTWDAAHAVTIDAGMAEIVESNTNPNKHLTREATNTVLIRAEATGLVEVIRND